MTNELKMKKTALASGKKKHRGASLNEKKSRMGWVFILPFIIGLVFIYASVIYESFIYSFAQYNTIPAIKGGGYSLTWVGFSNFTKQLIETTVNDEGKTFLEMMLTSFAQQILDIIIIIMFSLFIAVLLNQKMVGRAAFRAIFFIPVVVSAGIIAKIDNATNTILESMVQHGRHRSWRGQFQRRSCQYDGYQHDAGKLRSRRSIYRADHKFGKQYL